jgi:hypothetical protein
MVPIPGVWKKERKKNRGKDVSRPHDPKENSKRPRNLPWMIEGESVAGRNFEKIDGIWNPGVIVPFPGEY